MQTIVVQKQFQTEGNFHQPGRIFGPCFRFRGPDLWTVGIKDPAPYKCWAPAGEKSIPNRWLAQFSTTVV